MIVSILSGPLVYIRSLRSHPDPRCLSFYVSLLVFKSETSSPSTSLVIWTFNIPLVGLYSTDLFNATISFLPLFSFDDIPQSVHLSLYAMFYSNSPWQVLEDRMYKQMVQLYLVQDCRYCTFPP